MLGKHPDASGCMRVHQSETRGSRAVRIVYYNRRLNEPWGPGVHARALVCAWRRGGHAVLCLPEDLLEGEARPQVLHASRFRWIPDVLRAPALDIRARLRVLRSAGPMVDKMLAFRPDVLVARRGPYDYVLDRIVRKRGTLKLIAEVNAVLYWELREMAGEWLPAWEGARELRFLRSSDVAVAVSDAIASQLAQVGVDSQKTFAVPNGTDVSEFRPDVTPDPDIAHWAERWQEVVAYCGTFDANHDMETLARALSMVAARETVGFLFVGPTRAELIHVLGADALGGERVRCTGRVPHERVPGLLASADVSWAALANDRGSAMKLFEYMAMGLPVAWADEQQGRGVIEAAQCGLCVHRGDAAGLADAALRLLDDRKEAARMGASGRSWVEQHASWDQVAAGMLECLDAIR